VFEETKPFLMEKNSTYCRCSIHGVFVGSGNSVCRALFGLVERQIDVMDRPPILRLFCLGQANEYDAAHQNLIPIGAKLGGSAWRCHVPV